LTEDKDLGVSGKNDQIMVRGMPRHVVGYLKEFLFDENQARGPVSVLSGGEKARLLLSRIMARESNLLVMDEPTNDLDVETLDLLQEILDGYDGTVLLVSHDRDFLDRVATTTLAFEGNGVVTPYAGGWTDYQTQKKLRGGDGEKVVKKSSKKKQNKSEKAPVEKAAEGLSFSQIDRLEKLPVVIERTEAEIAKLEEFLSQPDLFTENPVKFQKATDGLIERHEILASLEEEWMELEALKEAT
jgi:ATP-binding cassette subfamily F protein uup